MHSAPSRQLVCGSAADWLAAAFEVVRLVERSEMAVVRTAAFVSLHSVGHLSHTLS